METLEKLKAHAIDKCNEAMRAADADLFREWDSRRVYLGMLTVSPLRKRSPGSKQKTG
jgi:hypothetical protein